MKFAVTGSSGFIASYLCRKLVAQGVDLVSLSSSSVQHEGAFDSTFVLTPESPEELFVEALKDVDVVIHLAGLAHRPRLLSSYADYLPYHNANCVYTKKLLVASIVARVKRLVFVSSIGAQSLSSPSAYIPNNYTITKAFAELLVATASSSSSLEFVIIRPPLVYAKGCPGNLARLRHLFRSLPFNVFSAFDAKKSFISLPNLIEVLCLSAVHPRLANKTYEVSDPTPLSVSLLAQLFYKNPSPSLVLRILSRILKTLVSLLFRRSRFYLQVTSEQLVDSTPFMRDSGWSPSANNSPPDSCSFFSP